MESRWSDADAQVLIDRYADRFNEDIALRVYTSRLIGRESDLVLHGGGNTSVKTQMRDDLGQLVDVLCVKGSGWDLAEIEPEGLPAVRLEPLQKLRELPALDDEAMVNAQRIRMLDASAPNPSVETLLHAFLPHKFVDHSHADAILALVDQLRAPEHCRERFGTRLGIVPYVMPGFELAKRAAEIYELNPEVEGLLLLQHGLFTFGSTARQSYERHMEAVGVATEFEQRRRYWSTRDSLPPLEPVAYRHLAPVLRGLLGEGERRYSLTLRRTQAVLDFVSDPKLQTLSQQGPATPDHVIRTKQLPLIVRVEHGRSMGELTPTLQRALADYRSAYVAYVERQMARKGIVVTPLDPDPRIILVPGLGMIAAGATAAAANVAADIYEHTIGVIRSASVVDAYQALPEDDIFDMEYWSLEQAKLGKASPRPLDGQVVIVTGAATGIGEATARHFARAGAQLSLFDRDAEALQRVADSLGAAHHVVDVADERALRDAVTRTVEFYGGLDGVVSNAGVAPRGAMAGYETASLRESFDINLFAHQWLASAATEIFRLQSNGGFLLFNASKAAFNPGADFGPYALPKAALIALMRQYAIEGGDDRIRSNAVNADRIRTSLLSAGDVQERALARGLQPDDYYRANLLGHEVTADDVAQAFVQLALARSTTGAVFTVDGGNIAAAPR